MIELSLEYPRREGLKEIIYAFVVKSTVSRAHIPNKLKKINALLTATMVEEQCLQYLEIRYQNDQPDKDPIQLGEISIEIDWHQHAIEVSNGHDTFHLDKDDPLGSLSPGLSELANRIRLLGLKDGANNISYAVRWTPQVYLTEGKHGKLCEAHGLLRDHNANDANVRAKAAYDAAEKYTISLSLEDASETKVTARWRLNNE